jgi:hypothetical protein
VLTVKVDKQKRVRLPDAKPGQLFSIENNGAGVIVLRALKSLEAKPVKSRLVRDKEGVMVLQSDQPIDEEALKIALSEFP